MTTISTRDLHTALRDIRGVAKEPFWDFVIYCRFLADRLPDGPQISAPALANLAEEVIDDLGRGTDRVTGKSFSTPLLNDRGEIVYDHFRSRLVESMAALAGDEYAAEVRSRLRSRPPVPAETETAGPGGGGKEGGGD